MNLKLKTKILFARNNPKKIIEYLNDSQYDLTADDKCDMIESLKNIELVRIAIKDASLGFNGYHNTVLISSVKNIDFIRECLKDENLGLTYRDKAELIKETKDIELVREYLQNEGNGKGRKYNEELIVSTENFKFIEECLFDQQLGFDEQQKVRIIAMTENEKFIRKCLFNEQLSIKNEQKARLVRALGKVDLVEQYIYDESLGYNKSEKIRMISATDNRRFIKKCLSDERLGFDTNEKISLLLYSDDLKLIKDCLEDKTLNFTVEQKVQLIIAADNRTFMHKCLKGNVLGLNDSEKELLINSTQDIFFIKECVENGDIDINKLSNIQKAQIGIIDKNKKQIDAEYGRMGEKIVKLPKNMTIGMEIESEGIASEFLGESFAYGKWKAKGDGSLENGIEIISPILYSTEKDSQEIYTVTNILNNMGQYISDKCGGHVHIGASYLTSVQSYINLLELYCNNERALYAMTNRKGETPRNGTVQYASPISSKMYNALENGRINLEDEKTLNHFIKELKEVQEKRYSGINFMNLNNSKNTIEFRLANGSIEPEMWIENVNLFGGMVAVSEELAQIQKNGARTEEDKYKLEIFNKSKEDIDEKEKVVFLLELAGVDPNTYMERYKMNIELMKGYQEFEEIFVKKEPLDFRVVKDKFEGKECVEIESSAHIQIEAGANIIQGHERNIQNDRNYTH